MSSVDWSKAGKRIRHQLKEFGRNPDWNAVEQRWKDEADYYGEELAAWEVVAMVACTVSSCCACVAPIAGRKCTDARGRVMDEPHRQRRRAAGVDMLRRHGPRFGGEIVEA